MVQASDGEVSVISPLLVYSFLMPLVLQYLTDKDVLHRFVLTGKCVKPYLINYVLKCPVYPDDDIENMVGQHRYLPVIIRKIHSAANIAVLAYFPQLEYLEFDKEFNDPVPVDSLPRSLKHIKFSNLMVQEIGRNLPPGLLSMDLYDNGEDCHLEPGMIPDTVTHLTLADEFMTEILPGSLPILLKELHIGIGYEVHFKPNVLPPSLTNLTFDRFSEFDQYFEPGILPLSLESLQLGEYNQKLDNPSLFPNLKRLWFGGDMSLAIPPTVTDLVVDASLLQVKIIGPVPNSVTHLRVCGEIPPGLIPMSVANLTIDASFHAIGTIPSSVTHLTISSLRRGIPVGCIPTSVTHLQLNYFSESDLPVSESDLPGVIPNSVKYLRYCEMTSLATGSVPDSVVWLALDRLANGLQPGMLPHSLRFLSFISCSMQSCVVGSLPDSLETLIFGHDFNQPIAPHTLPQSLKCIEFGRDYNHPFLPDSIPSTAREVVLPNSYPAVDSLSHITANITMLEPGRRILWEDDMPIWSEWSRPVTVGKPLA